VKNKQLSHSQSQINPHIPITISNKKPKISIVGAGNVGGLAAMRLQEMNVADITLIDVTPGLAEAKGYDMADSRYFFGCEHMVKGSCDIGEINNSDILIVTAGFARRPGMSRDGLLKKNALILKEIAGKVKELAANSIVIVVSNPVDILTYLFLKWTGFSRTRVFGMGISLDAARFANLISEELNISICGIEPVVIGIHGQGMMPLFRFTRINGKSLNEVTDSDTLDRLLKKTIDRGAQIVSLLGKGSAYFAPSAAIKAMVEIILKDEKSIVGLSAYLDGEYGLQGVCMGIPCILGRNGIEKIIELDLNQQERQALLKSACVLKQQYSV
jgi:malate dehydrogenase